MKPLQHIKLAAFVGLLAGTLVGIIDITARIIALSFEWFEFYQNLLISVVVVTLTFTAIAIFVELIAGIIRIKPDKKTLSLCYFGSVVPLLLLIYGVLLVKNYIYTEVTFWTPVGRTATYLITASSILVYILLLTKWQGLVFAITSFIKEKKVMRFINNFIFALVIFIISSFFIDLYLFTHYSNFVPEGNLDGHPNILFIVLDTVRVDHLSLYGYDLDTSPNIDRLGKNSVVFDNALSPSSWTLPSHASMFTGRDVSHHNVTKTYDTLRDDETTLAEILKAKGYNTAGFTGSPWTKARYGFGQGFITYKDRLDFFEYSSTFSKFSIRSFISFFLQFKFEESVLKDYRKRPAEQINTDIFNWLDKNKGHPFFMFINYYDAHFPYTPDLNFKKKFTNKRYDYRRISMMRNRGLYDKYLVSYMISLYDAEINYIDYHIGNLLDRLDALGIKNDTIIIITADHGEEFYEHGGYSHGNTLYNEVIHVPLIVYYPKEFKPQRIEKRIGTIDTFSTILNMLKIEAQKNIDSASLITLIKNGKPYSKNYALSELFKRPNIFKQFGFKIDEIKPQIAVFYNNWKLIKVYAKKKIISSELFDLANDPKERENLYYSSINKTGSLQKYIINMTADFESWKCAVI